MTVLKIDIFIKINLLEIIFRPQNQNLTSFIESNDSNLPPCMPTHSNSQIQFNQ